MLNDALSKHIIEGVIIPYFKQGNFYGGIKAGINPIVRLISGEQLPSKKIVTRKNQSNDFSIIGLILFVLAVYIGKTFGAISARVYCAVITGLVVIAVSALFFTTFLYSLGFGVLSGLFVLQKKNGGRGSSDDSSPGDSGRSGSGFSDGGGSSGGVSGRW